MIENVLAAMQYMHLPNEFHKRSFLLRQRGVNFFSLYKSRIIRNASPHTVFA